MTAETYFAPAPRAPEEVVAAQSSLFKQERPLQAVYGGVSELLAVLNGERQVVFANQALLNFLALEGTGKVYGRRLGELLSCIHAEENPGGCGTAEDCRYCGAILTVLDTFREEAPFQGECTICSHGPAVERIRNFRIRTIPLAVENQLFVLVSFQDLNQLKRKATLERIFFHDILNTVSSLKVNLELIKRTTGVPEHLVKKADNLASALAEEIKSQKMLLNAENRTLQVRRDLIASLSFLEDVLEGFYQHPLAEERELSVAPFSEDFTIISDSAILRRVLVNAVKNALEASPPGSRVTVAIRQEEEWAGFRVCNPGEIPPEVRSRLFHRYFSTKGENRGLGTYSMKLLAEEYLGGTVTFETGPDRGTTFIIRIPPDIRPGAALEISRS